MAAPYGAHHYLGEFADDSSADAFLTAQGLGSPVAGLLYFNTGAQRYHMHSGVAWVPLVRTDDPRLGQGTGTSGPVLVSFSEANKIFKESTSAVYENIQDFPFPGTTKVGPLASAVAVVHRVGGTSMDIRLVDKTNAVTIAELQGITDTTPSLRILSVVGTPSTTPAIWSVEMRRVGGGSTARCSAILLEF